MREKPYLLYFHIAQDRENVTRNVSKHGKVSQINKSNSQSDEADLSIVMLVVFITSFGKIKLVHSFRVGIETNTIGFTDRRYVATPRRLHIPRYSHK